MIQVEQRSFGKMLSLALVDSILTTTEYDFDRLDEEQQQIIGSALFQWIEDPKILDSFDLDGTSFFNNRPANTLTQEEKDTAKELMLTAVCKVVNKFSYRVVSVCKYFRIIVIKDI